jgi:hypothetical protein
MPDCTCNLEPYFAACPDDARQSGLYTVEDAEMVELAYGLTETNARLLAAALNAYALASAVGMRACVRHHKSATNSNG